MAVKRKKITDTERRRQLGTMEVQGAGHADEEAVVGGGEIHPPTGQGGVETRD